VEGLAEFYSLELQRRAGLIDNKAYNKALRSFRKYGLWGVDLRQQRDNAATNNSAPLVLHALDQQILKRTGGMHRLDDVLALAANEKQHLTTRRFAALCSKVAGGNVDGFFEKYVYRGETPLLHANR
jgi:predicted metalloprotease with PDZ domain